MQDAPVKFKVRKLVGDGTTNKFYDVETDKTKKIEFTLTMTKDNSNNDVNKIIKKGTINDDSEIEFTELAPGTYSLTESDHPDEYMGPMEGYTITVTPEGEVQFSGNLDPNTGYYGDGGTDSDGTKTLLVRNYHYVTMPESGSRSALYCFILGSLLTLVGCYILFHRERGAE